jgi:hypothetical protein
MTEAWPGGDARTVPGPRHPPGLYGDSRQRRAVNLAPLLPGYRPMVLPSGAILLDDAADDAAWRLAPGLLTLALLLLLADLALLTRWRGHAAAAALLLLLTPAAEAGDSLAAKDVAAALDSRLAFVLTGDAATDAASRAGLANLSRQVVRRTTTLLAEPDGVDLEHDALAVYPLLYWPLTTTMPALSGAAKGRLNDFMRHGGLLLIDSRDGGGNDQERLRQLTRGLDIPALQRVDDQHVLAKSFYLLHDFPGRWSGAALFAEQGGDAAHDFVSPVLIGGNDWAGAWAAGPQGEPLFALVPGGENQREMAVRFGVNLVIYALTGSYKADQVHLPAILERMRR